MLLLRILGSWFLIAAMIAAIYDGTKSLGGSGLVLTPLGDHWFGLHPASFNFVKEAIQSKAHPALWDPVMVTVLSLPAWAVFGILGLLLYIAGRRREGINIFSN